MLHAVAKSWSLLWSLWKVYFGLCRVVSLNFKLLNFKPCFLRPNSIPELSQLMLSKRNVLAVTCFVMECLHMAVVVMQDVCCAWDMSGWVAKLSASFRKERTEPQVWDTLSITQYHAGDRYIWHGRCILGNMGMNCFAVQGMDWCWSRVHRSWQDGLDGGRILARGMEPDQTLLSSYIQDITRSSWTQDLNNWIMSQWGRISVDRFSLSLWCHSNCWN